MDTSLEIEKFIAATRAFEKWVRDGDSKGEIAGIELLRLLCCLYTAALCLPPEPLSDEIEPVDGSMRKQIIDSFRKRIAIDYYGVVFDPLCEPPEAPVTGSLSDDLAGIYDDVISGLRAYDRGAVPGAIGHWVFSLNCHWGRHITGAIRTLHCWLAQDFRLCSTDGSE